MGLPTSFSAIKYDDALDSAGTLWSVPGCPSQCEGTLGQPATFAQVATNVADFATTQDDSDTIIAKSDGTVWVWGTNFNQLGAGVPPSQGGPAGYSQPIQVTSLSGQDIVRVGTSGPGFYAVRSDGAVYVWGVDESGDFCSTTLTSSATPALIPGLSSVSQVVGYYRDVMFVLSGGTVEACGDNTFGELGNGTENQFYDGHLTAVSNLTSVTQVAWSDYSSGEALTSSGTMYSWGANQGGGLGTGQSGPDVLTPQAVTDLGGTPTQIGNEMALVGTSALIWGDQSTIRGGPIGPTPVADLNVGAIDWPGVDAYALESALVQPQGSAVGADSRGGGSRSQPCQCAGSTSVRPTRADPIDPATGDLYESTTDLNIPGAGVPLAFSRTYDAQAAQAEVAAGSPVPALGYGWAYNLGMSVGYDAGTQTAAVTEENGAQTTFAPYVSGSSPAWCSGATNFCATAPRTAASLNRNGDGSWTYIRNTDGQQTFNFSATGALLTIADPTGDTLASSSYSPGTGQIVCPSGDVCTAWTSSSSGRELVLAVTGAGQLASVFDPTSGLTANFSYSGTGCSTWGLGQTAELCRVTDPGNLTTTFTYDSTNTTASFDYDMLTDTPAGMSAATTNVYDSSGRVTQQTDPAGAVTTFSYTGTNSSYAGGDTTVTTYPLGTGSGKPQEVTDYQYSSNVLVEETAEAGTSTQSTQVFFRDPASLRPLSSVDGDFHSSTFTYQTYSGTGGTSVSSANVLTSTDALGNTTQHAYNSFNQPWCTVDAADYANGVRCPSTAPTSPSAPGITDPYVGVSLAFYNSSDQLTAQTDGLGNTTSYSYTSGVAGVPNGLTYCAVDPVSYQKGVTCPAYGAPHVTGTATATFDSAGDKTSTTDADGNTTSYVYNAAGHPGLVSAMTDPDGTVTAYSYNGAGEVISQAVTFGSYAATTLYAYDSYGRKYCEVDPYEAAQSVTCPSSAPSSSPTPSSDPYLGATITTYDANGRVVQVTNPIGGITYTAYDQAGEAFCTVDPYEAALGVTCPSTAPSSPPTVGSDPYLGATITSYDGNSRVVQVTNPAGGLTLTAYDAAGNVTQSTVESNNVTSAPNVVTANTFDSDNRVVSTTLGYGSSAPSTTSDFYDPNGNVFCTVSATAYAAGSSTYQCPQWQPAWITSPPSPTALYSTTPTSSQANNVTTAFYNANGQQVQTTNPDLATSIAALDGDGRIYCTSDPVNVSSWLSGHSGGTYPYLCPNTPPSTPPATGSNPGYVTTIYDPAGSTLSTTDQVGDTTATTYDPAGHPLTVTDPRGQVTTNCYYYQNGSGQCAASAPAGGGSGDDLYSTTTPATSADPSGETTASTYYPGDEPEVVTSPAGKTTNSYDANLDPTSVAYSNTASGYAIPANVSYTYYKDGSRHTMVDGTGTTTYTEDALGDITQQQLSATGSGLKSNTVNYSYYSTGALASASYPSYGTYSTPTATYSYDALGNMASVTDWLSNKVTFSHDGDGNLTSQKNAVSTTNPNGTSSTAFSYDHADQNTQAASTLNCSASNGTLTQYFSGANGSRNLDGQVTQDQDVYASPCSGTTYQRNYSYDPAGRIAYQGATGQGANPNNFAYDASGDPTTISSHDSSNNFDTYTQAFDSAGEVNSQTPIAGSNGVTSTYSYDTLGDRTQSVAGSTTTNYGFNQIGQMTSAAIAGTTTTYQYSGAGLEAATSSPGIGWASASSIDGTKMINSLSCATSTFCVAVDANGNAINYTGTWGPASSIDGTKVINSVSCATTTFCVAVDASGNAIKYTGTWGAASSIDSKTSITAVSCPSSTFCEAVDASGNALKYNGSTWATSLIDRHNVLDSISCQSTTFCEAVDNAGNVLKYNGSTWTSGNVDSTRTLKSVSCPATTFCAAVDANGNVLTYNGTTWSSPTDIDSSTSLNSTSCTNSTTCQVADANGNTLTYNGTAWSNPLNIDGTTALDTISCTSSTACQVADATGRAISYGPTTLTSQLTWDSNNPLAIVLSDSSNDYIYGPTGQPVEQISLTSSTPTYLTYTPADSTWVSTNQTGAQTGFWGYDTYGSLAFGTPTSPFGYSGQYLDTTTGQVNDRARWYQPQTGTFTSRDPAFAVTDTAYTYAGEDPVNNSDPSGLFCVGSICTRFDPGAGLKAIVNIGRGASFGLSDKVANWIQPGASCTIAQSSIDKFIGGSASSLVAGEGAGKLVGAVRDALGAEGEATITGARGVASGRPFEPELAGGPIQSLSTEGVQVTEEGVGSVAQHLQRFVQESGSLEGPEQEMLGRLQAIAAGDLEPTQYDLNFYTHELDEAARYANVGYGGSSYLGGPDTSAVWNNVHTAALEDYGITDADLFLPGMLP